MLITPMMMVLPRTDLDLNTNGALDTWVSMTGAIESI